MEEIESRLLEVEEVERSEEVEDRGVQKSRETLTVLELERVLRESQEKGDIMVGRRNV